MPLRCRRFNFYSRLRRSVLPPVPPVCLPRSSDSAGLSSTSGSSAQTPSTFVIASKKMPYTALIFILFLFLHPASSWNLINTASSYPTFWRVFNISAQLSKFLCFYQRFCLSFLFAQFTQFSFFTVSWKFRLMGILSLHFIKNSVLRNHFVVSRLDFTR